MKSILLSIFILISTTAFAGSNAHKGVAHDSTGHHIGGSTQSSSGSSSSSYSSTYAAPSNYYAGDLIIIRQQENREPGQPKIKPESQKVHDQFMDAFKRNKPQKPPEARVPKTGHADNYKDEKGILRDGKTGKIHRSQTAIHDFRKNHPCPNTGKTDGACPGYQVDHKLALKNGGKDDPSNMRWLSTAEHQRKSASE